MFPLRDDAPRSGFPTITVALIVINVVVFAYQASLLAQAPHAEEAFVMAFGAVPAKISLALAGRSPLLEGLIPVLTSMFLHGGLMHLVGNMWFLWIFGDNVEDELGHVEYLLFYLLCGVIAAAAHYASNPYSTVPTVGASGAISGVMGAYMVRFPFARITTLIPIFILFTTVELPALVMLVYWFVIQFVSGAAETGLEGTGVAWWAHIGGFVAGAVLIWIKPRKTRRSGARYRRVWDH
ncbi:MAG: rhomboid family intramembrane serine protease [Acidobacteria bacterium]|nr:rhomboid family intramembrane serine protease [Acidobacteriota bacterium]